MCHIQTSEVGEPDDLLGAGGHHADRALKLLGEVRHLPFHPTGFQGSRQVVSLTASALSPDRPGEVRHVDRWKLGVPSFRRFL